MSPSAGSSAPDAAAPDAIVVEGRGQRWQSRIPRTTALAFPVQTNTGAAGTGRGRVRKCARRHEVRQRVGVPKTCATITSPEVQPTKNRPGHEIDVQPRLSGRMVTIVDDAIHRRQRAHGRIAHPDDREPAFNEEAHGGHERQDVGVAVRLAVDPALLVIARLASMHAHVHAIRAARRAARAAAAPRSWSAAVSCRSGSRPCCSHLACTSAHAAPQSFLSVQAHRRADGFPLHAWTKLVELARSDTTRTHGRQRSRSAWFATRMCGSAVMTKSIPPHGAEELRLDVVVEEAECPMKPTQSSANSRRRGCCPRTGRRDAFGAERRSPRRARRLSPGRRFRRADGAPPAFADRRARSTKDSTPRSSLGCRSETTASSSPGRSSPSAASLRSYCWQNVTIACSTRSAPSVRCGARAAAFACARARAASCTNWR